MPEMPAAALKVLLVEDDEDDYVLTREMLSKIENPAIALSWASCYQDGLEALERNEHDVYFVDYCLGDRNGLELLRRAQSERCFGRPMIILTGQEGSGVDAEAMKAGAADYLLKSQISTPLLERAIRHCIERAKTLEALHKLASYDELTGLFNRRELDRLLRDGVNRYLRYSRPTALALLDVDYFKIINDTYGHQVGDEVLRWLGSVVRTTLREVDFAARYGGEELAVVLPEMTGRQAFGMAERLRRRISAQPFTFTPDKKQPIKLSIAVSLGVAGLPEDADSAVGLVEAADRCLYEAKRRGRNRTIQACSLPLS